MDLKKVFGSFALILTALIWGSTFVAQSVSMDMIGAFTFQATRSVIGFLVLIPVIWVMDFISKKRGTYKKMSDGDKKFLLKGGVVCGTVLCVSSCLQQFGIAYTTVGKAGFITALYIVMVPILGLFFNKKASKLIWLCVGISVVGLYLLCITDGFYLSIGDTLVFICSICFAGHILVVDHYSPKTDAVRLSCIQFLVCAVISSVLMFIFENPSMKNILAAWFPIFYAGVMSCGIAYTLQIVGQKYIKPVVASLLMSLESVFAVISGIIILKQIPTAREALGCIFMFAAIIIAQLPSKEKN